MTFDGIPFGDANDPSHHSAAYLPPSFIGQLMIDRGPGPASQFGYATYGGTLSILSRDLSDRLGGTIATSYGNFGTFTTSAQLQSGVLPTGGRLLLGFSHASSKGTLFHGTTAGDFGIIKFEQPLGDFTLTALSSIGRERYNNVGSITYSQWQTYGKSYGSLSSNPAWNTFVGYNNSLKQTDFDYIKIKGDIGGFQVSNQLYTYAYGYPRLQNNGADLSIDGPDTITSVKIPQPDGSKKTVTVLGIPKGSTDVTGYLKNNNFRSVGDIFNISRDINAGLASGTLRTGVWVEHIDNQRSQQYLDYTTGQTYTQLGNPENVAYKLRLDSQIDTFQPFAEYEWKPIEGLAITPGYKFIAFTRDHYASVNQTTLAPISFDHTYTAGLPFITVRYRVNPETSVYVQASQGFLAPPVAAYYVFDPNSNTVQPQRTNNYQIGAVYKSGKLTADADLYMINASHFSSSSNTTTGATFFKDGGDATYKGIEAELSYSLINGFSLYASGSLSSARYDATGLAIGGAPSFTAAGGVIYDDGHLFGSVLTKVIGNSWGSSGNDQVTGITITRVPTYSSTDAVLGYRTDAIKQLGIGQMLEFKAGVNNIFNSRAVTDIGGTPASNIPSTANLTYQFQPARTFFAGLKVDF